MTAVSDFAMHIVEYEAHASERYVTDMERRASVPVRSRSAKPAERQSVRNGRRQILPILTELISRGEDRAGEFLPRRGA